MKSSVHTMPFVAVVVVAVLGASLVLPRAVNAVAYSYDSTANNPMSGWATSHPNYCSATANPRQSPVAIDLNALTEDSALAALVYSGSAITGTVENDGHSIKVHSLTSSHTISGGSLTGDYKLEQLHIHWSASDSEGSEHTIGGDRGAAEVHFVFWKTTGNADFNAAVATGDGDALAVYGVLMKVGARNEALKFIDLASSLTAASSTATVDAANAVAFADIFDGTNFVHYEGGLTTPGCNGVVMWFVRRDFLTISAAQLQLLRALTLNYGDTRNWRALQSLGSRTLKIIPTHTDSAASSLSVALLPTAALALLGWSLAMMA